MAAFEGCETENTEEGQTKINEEGLVYYLNEAQKEDDNDNTHNLDEISNVADGKEEESEPEMVNVSDIISTPATRQRDDFKVNEQIKTDTTKSQPSKTESNIYLFGVLVVFLAIGIGIFLMFSAGQNITEPDPIFICPNKGMVKYIDIQQLHATITANNTKQRRNTTFYWDVTQNETECDSLQSYGEFADTLKLVWDWDCSPHDMTIKLYMEAEANSNIYNQTCNINVIFYESPVFGIDLGTTYSCIAFQKSTKNIDNRRQTKIVVVDKILNRYCIPSAVYFGSNKKIEFGVDALDKLQSDGLNVVYDIKRIIGRDTDDKEIEEFKKHHLFKIDDDHKSVFLPNTNGTVLFEQILSLILGYLVETASMEWFRNENRLWYIRDVVVSVPALFHNGQRKAIRSSCHLAGLNPIKLVIEPSAGSLAHSYYNKIPTNKLKFFLSFDFGGGTLDCSIMRCTGVQCNVLSVHGNNQLGGVDFDHVIRDIIVAKFKKQHALTEMSNNMYSKIVKISEEIKIDLTHLIEYELILENDDGEAKSVTITRDEFEQHPKTKKLVQLTIDSVNDAIGTKQGNIRMILMIGGSSKIPIIQTSLRDTFGDILVFPDIDAQLMVVTGCGIVGGALAFNNGQSEDKYKDVVLTDVIPLSLGFESCVADTEDRDGDGDYIDCGVMRVILPKDSPFGMQQKPISVCQVMADDTTLDLGLYEGGHHYVKDNHFLGKITIEDIKPRQVETCDNVQFSFVVDENGIATVEATTNEKYGEVKRYKIITHIENAEHGSIQNVKKLKQEMISWYPKSFTLLKKALKAE